MSIRYRDQIIGGSEKFISVTQSQYDTLVSNSQLIPGAIYNITDDVTEDVVPDATSSVKGVMKLYNTVGTNTDGTMTQASIKSNFVSSSRFLPNGTVITVGASGKDFTSFTDAIEYIKFKFSDGVITIQLDAGTYVLPLGYGIPTSNFNFGLLVIKGAGDTTILQRQSTDWAWVPTLNISSADAWGTPVRLESLCIDSKSNKGDSYNTRGLGVEGGNCSVKNITIKNTSSGGMYSNGGITTIVGSITVTNTAYALEVDGGILKATFGVNLYGNNVTTYVTVNGGGIFQMWSATKHFTNVTNQTSQAIGTTNAAGYIGGNWS